jgi:hypothetical protein
MAELPRTGKLGIGNVVGLFGFRFFSVSHRRGPGFGSDSNCAGISIRAPPKIKIHHGFSYFCLPPKPSPGGLGPKNALIYGCVKKKSTFV